MGNFMYGVIQVVKQPFKLLYPTKIYGFENVEDKKVILAFNHLSGWDSVVWSIWSNKRTHFMYKSSFDKSWFLRSLFKSLEFVSVRRGQPDIAAIKKSVDILNSNKIFGVFPEGTRNKEVDCLQEFKVGTAMLAIKSHAPIRPIYIFDRMKKFHKNYMLVGDEFTLEEYYDTQLTRQVLEEATEKVKQKMDEARIKLNEILKEKGVVRRQRTKKELREREIFIKAKAERARIKAEHNAKLQNAAEEQFADSHQMPNTIPDEVNQPKD